MNIKRLLAVVLSAVMLLGVLTVAYAESGDAVIPEDGDISLDIGAVETVPDETEDAVLVGDINEDGKVDYLDLGALQAQLSGKVTGGNQDACDINADGDVDFLDLSALQAHLTGKRLIA